MKFNKTNNQKNIKFKQLYQDMYHFRQTEAYPKVLKA